MNTEFDRYKAALDGLQTVRAASRSKENALEAQLTGRRAALDRESASASAKAAAVGSRLTALRTAVQALPVTLPTAQQRATPSTSDPLALAAQVLDDADAEAVAIRDDIAAIAREHKRVEALRQQSDADRAARDAANRRELERRLTARAAGNKVVMILAASGAVATAVAVAVLQTPAALAVALVVGLIGAGAVKWQTTGVPSWVYGRRAGTPPADELAVDAETSEAARFAFAAFLALAFFGGVLGGFAASQPLIALVALGACAASALGALLLVSSRSPADRESST